MKTGIIGGLHGKLVFGRRTQVLARHFAELLPRDARVLDVGCGDGSIDRMIMDQRPDIDICGIDIMRRPTTHIPVEEFDGAHFPAADNSFDVVTFIDVLHHTDDPLVLLREATRVARRMVLIKDHISNNILDYGRLWLMDWVGNAHHNVVLPYNYWSERRWRAAFAELGLHAAVWRGDVGLYRFPLSVAFDSRLHVIAALETPAS